MTRLASAVIVCILLFSSAWAQSGATVATGEAEKASADTANAKAARVSSVDERKAYGRKMLEAAEADGKGLQGGMRAYALFRVAQCYAPTDKNKAVELLDDAFNATKEMDEDRVSGRGDLQQRILRAMVPIAPDHADELLPYVDPRQRSQVMNALLGYYQKNKQLDRAVEVVFRVSQEAEFPYFSAASLMQELPEDQNALLIQLFTAALGSYRDHAPHGGAGGTSLDSLIIKFWRRLPPDLVKDAIAETLKQTRPTDTLKKQDSGMVSMASAKGAVSLGGYDFLLFELLPVLKQLDESQADSLLKEHQSVQALLDQYPEGVASLRDSRKGGGGTSYSGGPATPERVAAARAQSQAQAQVAKIVADADAHPRDALANALALEDKSSRAGALVNIAQAVWQKDEGIAKDALRAAVDAVSNSSVDGEQSVMFLENAARLYLKMGDTESAKQATEKGFAAAARLYKQDTDADDPNTALKAYWPSTDAYSRFLRVAGQISPRWAFTALKEIPDPEARSLAESALASGWLGVPMGETLIVDQRKKFKRQMVKFEN